MSLNTPRDTTVKAIATASETTSVAATEMAATLKSIDTTLKKQNNLDPQSMLDGTRKGYIRALKKFLDSKKAFPGTLNTFLDEWFTETNDGWHGWVDFLYTGVSSGTRGGDAENLTCNPSTNTVAGQDDYAGLPLFVCLDCNWTKDPETLEPVITAISGVTDGFERHNPEKLVGVLQQSAWIYQKEGSESWRFGYSSEQIEGENSSPLPEAIRVDGSIRPWMVHSKYPGKVVNGKWTCYSGVIPTAFSISHNTSHTISAATGTGISGTCYCDWDFPRKMAMIKYASLTMDGIIQGCLSNDKRAKAAVSETGVRRLLVPSSAPAFEVGMGVLVGAINATGDEITRSATNYNISGNGGCLITAIETVTVGETEYKAIYVDTADTFDTTADETCIMTFHWPTGSCDNILGNDGSPNNPGSGVYPGKIQGIEFSLGALIALSDVVDRYTLEDEVYYHELHFVDRTANQASTLTENYRASGYKHVQPSSTGHQFIKHMKLVNGVFVPSEYGASSSTYIRDSNYVSANTTGLHELLVVGNLSNGTSTGGLSYATLHYGLGYAYWNIVGGPSPNGDRGKWGEWAA